MPEKSAKGKNPGAMHSARSAQRQKTRAPSSARKPAPAKSPTVVASASPAPQGVRVRPASKGPLGTTAAALSKYASTVNNPAVATRLAAAREQRMSRLANPAYQESLGNAARRFKDFNLSKFAKSGTPENYIDPSKVNDRAAVHAKHRELIEKQLKNLKDKDTPNSGLTLSLPVERLDEVKKDLPGLGEKDGKIDLQQLLVYLRGHMTGTSIFSRGNPVLTRLTTETKARAEARKIIGRIKKQAGKTGTATAAGNSSHRDES